MKYIKKTWTNGDVITEVELNNLETGIEQHDHNEQYSALDHTHEEFTPKLPEKFLVICVAGQSNAVGYDESPVDHEFAYRPVPDRIFQLGLDDVKGNNLKIVPLTECADNLQATPYIAARAGTGIIPGGKCGNFGIQDPTRAFPGTRGVHLPLAKLLLNEIPSDFGILIVPVAYGGTGFNSGTYGVYDAAKMRPTVLTSGLRWGVTSAYYMTMRDRIKKVLKENPGSLFGGVVWCQGENDAGNPAAHYTAFQAMTEDFFTHMNTEEDGFYKKFTKKGTWDRSLWYTYETVAHWYSGGSQQIWDNYKAWSPETYVEVPRTAPCNVTAQTSSVMPSHFGQGAFANFVAPNIVRTMKQNNGLFYSSAK